MCVSERRRRSGRMREILRSSKEMDRLGSLDRALAARLALGTVAAEGFLDGIIDARLQRRSSVEPRVRDALRVAAFELCYLSTPGSVAVSQGVELVRSVRPRAAGMANAVLRRLLDEVRPQVAEARERCGIVDDNAPLSDGLLGSADEPHPQVGNMNAGAGPVDDHAPISGTPCQPDDELQAQGADAPACGSLVDDLVLVSGTPRWLVELVCAERGPEVGRRLFGCQLDPAPTYVVANRCRMDVVSAREALAEAGFDPRPTELAGSFALGRPAGLASSALVADADLIVSDLAAQRVARLAVPEEGGRILEIGQGRGTKTLLMASVAAERGVAVELVGIESVASKLRLCRERLERAGLGHMTTCVELDARRLGELGDDLGGKLGGGQFDAVLLDAPCSGVGTMRRHPEIAWSLAAEDVARDGALPQLQAELLAAASTQVRPGGTLAYATCSILPAEDEEVVDAFLASAAGRAFERLGAAFLTIPEQGGPDGHFCALLRRRP